MASVYGEEPPAWWETPKRSAVRAGLWIGCAAWAVAAIWCAMRQTTEQVAAGFLAECTPRLGGQVPQLTLCVAGILLTVWGLNVPPATVRGRALVVAGLVVLWALAAFAWGPAGDLDCPTR